MLFNLQAVLMVDRMISPFTLMAGPILFVLSMSFIRNLESWTDIVTALCIYVVWVLVSRTIRIIPHFYRCPGPPLSTTLALPAPVPLSDHIAVPAPHLQSP